jgi:hypothetical protein
MTEHSGHEPHRWRQAVAKHFDKQPNRVSDIPRIPSGTPYLVNIVSRETLDSDMTEWTLRVEREVVWTMFAANLTPAEAYQRCLYQIVDQYLESHTAGGKKRKKSPEL